SDPRTFLPLTPLACEVLLSLSDGARHGYGILREIEDRTDGRTRVLTGTLYTLLQRLVDEGLVAAAGRAAPDHDDRRGQYALTVLGRAVLQAEVRRLEAVVDGAKRKRVFAKTTKA